MKKFLIILAPLVALFGSCQKGPDETLSPEISIEPTILNFASEGGIQDVSITANFEYEVSATAEWIECAVIEGGIAVTVPNYAEVQQRNAWVIISNKAYNISKTIRVTQTGLSEEEYTACCTIS